MQKVNKRAACTPSNIIPVGHLLGTPLPARATQCLTALTVGNLVGTPLSEGPLIAFLLLIAGNLVGTLFHKEASQKFKQEWLQSQKEEANELNAQTENTGPRDMAVRARTASRALQHLSSKQREQLLHKIAENLLAKEGEIMQENDQDCQVGSSTPNISGKF